MHSDPVFTGLIKNNALRPRFPDDPLQNAIQARPGLDYMPSSSSSIWNWDLTFDTTVFKPQDVVNSPHVVTNTSDKNLVVPVSSFSVPVEADYSYTQRMTSDHYWGVSKNPLRSSASDGKIDFNSIGAIADFASHVQVVAEQFTLSAAKHNTQRILSNAWPLQAERMRSVATSLDMDKALSVFKDPNGKSATALAVSAAKYDIPFKGLGVVGWAATAVEEGSYIMDTYQNNSGKAGYAMGAAVTNVAGDFSAIYLGMKGGAIVGAWGAPYTFGLSIAFGALVGGIFGHFAYDGYVKPQVREGWTGIPNVKN